MIRSADFSDEAEIDLLPVAVVRQSLESVVGTRAPIRRAFDDLDWFRGADFLLDDNVRFSMRHYDGHPEGTFTIYLDRGVEKDPGAIALILREFKLPPQALAWENEAAARAHHRAGAKGYASARFR